jgi:molecular chaperone GrpE
VNDKSKAAEETAREIPIEESPAETNAASEMVDRLQRLQAEFENYKKRIARDAAEREERFSDQLLLEMLPLYDALGLAFENYNRDKDAEAFVAGTERIFAQFEQMLRTKGASRIDALGKPFDPAYHEALLSLESE